MPPAHLSSSRSGPALVNTGAQRRVRCDGGSPCQACLRLAAWTGHPPPLECTYADGYVPARKNGELDYPRGSLPGRTLESKGADNSPPPAFGLPHPPHFRLLSPLPRPAPACPRRVRQRRSLDVNCRPPATAAEKGPASQLEHVGQEVPPKWWARLAKRPRLPRLCVPWLGSCCPSAGLS